MSIKNGDLPDWDKIFRKEIANVFNLTRNIFLDHLSESEIKVTLRKIAFNFYNIFKNSPIPVLPPHPDLDDSEFYYSTSIMLPFSCFMIPYFFFNTLQEDINFNIEAELSLQLPWEELLGIINQKWNLKRKKLTKTDVLVCKVISRHGTQGQIDKFPLTYNIIANRTRKSLSTVKESVRTLFMRLIAHELFLFNPWKLGWNLFLCTYNFTYDDKFKEYDLLTISKEICANNRAFRIIQQPMISSRDNLESLNEICETTNGNVFEIDCISLNWNLDQLEYKNDLSFRQEPSYSPFSDKTIDNIKPNVVFTFEHNSVDWLYDLKNCLQRFVDPTNNDQFSIFENDTSFEIPKVEERQVEKVLRILNYLIDFGIQLKSFEATANYLQLSERELSKIIQFLIKNNIIALGHRFMFIGTGAEYSFIIENGSPELNSKIHQTLLQFPFCYAYQAENLIAGRCQVPSNWSYKFFELFTRLQVTHKELTINYGQRLLGYSFFNPNVKLPRDYILNEFGMRQNSLIIN